MFCHVSDIAKDMDTYSYTLPLGESSHWQSALNLFSEWAVTSLLWMQLKISKAKPRAFFISLIIFFLQEWRLESLHSTFRLWSHFGCKRLCYFFTLITLIVFYFFRYFFKRFPVAITCGNTSIIKPSERDPGATLLLMEMLNEAGCPPGVVNVIHGAHDSVNFICDNPDIKAISFVGSDQAGKYIYERGCKNGKRVQSNMGAKNHVWTNYYLFYFFNET